MNKFQKKIAIFLISCVFVSVVVWIIFNYTEGIVYIVAAFFIWKFAESMVDDDDDDEIILTTDKESGDVTASSAGITSKGKTKEEALKQIQALKDLKYSK